MGMKLNPDLERRVLELAAQATREPHRLGLQPLSEKAFDAAIQSLAKRHGWASFHTFDSRKCAEGFPDRILIRGPLLVAAELKVGDNQPTAAQLSWLEAFAGVREVRSRLWRPSDWDEIERVLTGRV